MAIRVASYSVVGYFLLAIAFVFTCLAIAQFVLLITVTAFLLKNTAMLSPYPKPSIPVNHR